MKNNNNLWRIVSLGVFFAVVAIVYIGRLLYLQVSGQDYYSMSTPTVYYTRKVTVQAQRGEIYDRNGKTLVANEYTYDISIDYATKPSTGKGLNDLLVDIMTAAARTGDELVPPKSSLDITVLSNGLDFDYPDGFLETVRGRRYAKLVSQLNVDEDADANEEARALMVYFGIMSREMNDNTDKYETFYNYTYPVAKELFLIRLDMELSGFSAIQPYVIAEDASLNLITSLEEKYARGFTVTTDYSRKYLYPGYASHILGRIGKIPAGQEDYYTELGYPLDAVVGISGVEAAFETYLRGVDGVMTITEDAYGNIVNTEITTEPIPGKDVYLTIDIDMQMVAEQALAENIFKIREEADPDKPLTGEDAEKGALTVLDVDTYEVLAICSYPTYNLATFNRDFAHLNSDELSPMFNRALNGEYAPGSTFKIGVSVAALSEEIITKETIIETKGIYTYYESANFTPRCWLYLMTDGQAVHGEIGVVEAIQESCNCFFYEVGRLLTISKMNEYCRHLGLGQPTGIELPESTGILAGPDYRAENGLGQWSPGDTIQAAIGQSDNQFTPLQISVYLATVLGGGTRYNASMLYQVRDYATGEIIYDRTPVLADSIKISDDILETVKEGMRGVMDNGSAASVFSGYEISVGGKTGTAQVYTNKSDNGIMTAFAPFEEPEIVVTCIIEQGYGGTQAGYAVRDVFDYYFADELAEIKEENKE